MEKFIAPLRKRRKEIIAQPEIIKNKLKEGALKVRPIAQRKIREVREKIGIEI